MQPVAPYIKIEGDSPNNIMARSATLTGLSKTSAVWHYGFAAQSDAAKAYGVHGGPVWVLATHNGRVLERLDGVWACELPERYKRIINAKLTDNIEGEDPIVDKYTLYTYDVWGNARDGFEVNNRYHRADDIELPECPSDKDIRKALGIKVAIETDGDDMTIYVNRASNGKPLCELIREE